MPRVLVLNGPNLNLLGAREPGIYGAATLADLERLCVEAGREAGLEVVCRQSNHEGELIEAVHSARKEADGLVINAAGYSHTSVALLDALRAFGRPIVEVHLSNIHRREVFRHVSYPSLAADGVICGLGPAGYRLALMGLAGLVAAPARAPG